MGLYCAGGTKVAAFIDGGFLKDMEKPVNISFKELYDVYTNKVYRERSIKEIYVQVPYKPSVKLSGVSGDGWDGEVFRIPAVPVRVPAYGKKAYRITASKHPFELENSDDNYPIYTDDSTHLLFPHYFAKMSKDLRHNDRLVRFIGGATDNQIRFNVIDDIEDITVSTDKYVFANGKYAYGIKLKDISVIPPDGEMPVPCYILSNGYWVLPVE